MKKVTRKKMVKSMNAVKKMKIDGRILVAILGTLLTRARFIQKEMKRKKITAGELHDLNVQSKTLSILIDDMLQAMVKELLRQTLQEHKKKAKQFEKERKRK